MLSEQMARFHHDAPLTDVHVHPSVKAYLFNRTLWRHYGARSVFNPFASRSDFKRLLEGGVGVIWAAHHLPERQLFSDCLWMRAAAAILLPTYRKLTSGSQFNRVMEMINTLEREIRRKPDRIELARSAADVTRIRGEGKIAVIHTVEGGHVLEGNLDNLDRLAERSVAMLTLTHFYPNGIAAQVDSIPKNFFVRKLCSFNFGIGTQPPLTEFGRVVLQKMKTLPMLVDITHCTLEAKGAVYEEINGERPILATHVGVTRYNPDVYNLHDDEIREIARSGGAVGVIFMTYWLDATEPKNGLEAIWKTLSHIREVTGSWEHIVLGSDFDGFTDPPDDIRDASRMGAVTEMLLQRDVDEANVKKILGGNAQRVLHDGWK